MFPLADAWAVSRADLSAFPFSLNLRKDSSKDAFSLATCAASSDVRSLQSTCRQGTVGAERTGGLQ